MLYNISQFIDLKKTFCSICKSNVVIKGFSKLWMKANQTLLFYLSGFMKYLALKYQSIKVLTKVNYLQPISSIITILLPSAYNERTTVLSIFKVNAIFVTDLKPNLLDQALSRSDPSVEIVTKKRSKCY